MTRADQRKFHYIYKITRQDGSGKYYIGMHSTDDLEDGYFGSGKLITRSINKHGKEKHSKEILEFLPNRKELKERERELVNEEIVNDPRCMNLQLGGGGGFSSPESKFKFHSCGGKISGKTNWKNVLVVFADSERKKHLFEKMSETRQKTNSFATMLGKTHSAETKQQMSNSGSGSKNSQFGTCWVTNGIPIKIKKEELDAYLANGYRRGRK